jgi:pimeloyl-ACP methyl ester carboxylesterase
MGDAANAAPPEGTRQGDPNHAVSCTILYAGFVGALESSNNKRSGIVQIRDSLQGPGYRDVCAKSFSPYTWNSGETWILQHFPKHPGRESQDDLASSPKVILIGHSAGGWAMLHVARDLNRRGIPVELTIQVDSVGINDHTVPANVKAGAIFHAHDILMFMTTKNLRLEDPARTTLVANVLVANAGHESVTRDKRIRELVMKTIESLRSGPTASGRFAPTFNPGSANPDSDSPRP